MTMRIPFTRGKRQVVQGVRSPRSASLGSIETPEPQDRRKSLVPLRYFEFFADPTPFMRQGLSRYLAKGGDPKSDPWRKILLSRITSGGTARRRMAIACSPWVTDGARDVPVISPIPRSPIYTGGQALEKRSKTCHIVPLFGTPGATESVQGSLGKPLQDHDLRPCQSPAELAMNRLA